ncbi:MAG: TolC family protein, partial [Wenzhouxiangella sp.]
LAAAHRFEAYSDWQDRLGDLGEIAARRSAAGDLSGYDSGRIRQSVELARFRLASVEAELMVSTEALAGLIGVDGLSIGVDPREVLLPDAELTSQAEPRQALGNAQLRALDEQRQATEATARAAERLSLPVTVGLGQRRLSGPVGSDDALILELSVPLPLFDRNQAERARARAEADRAESRYRMSLHERQSRAQAHRQELAMLASAANRLEADVLPLARELTAMANSSFAEGELELVELLAVMSAEIEAVDQLLDLQYRARLAWIELESLVEPDPTVTGEPP